MFDSSDHIPPQDAPRKAPLAALLIALLIALVSSADANAGEHLPDPSPQRARSAHFLSTSAFMLGNLLPEPPIFFQLNYGLRATDEDTILVEAITWRYGAPLGIPLWSGEYGAAQHDYPGRVQAFGVGLAYQRYLWRGSFITLHATPFWQTFRDLQGGYIQSGFQLFMAARVGYHIAFWKERLFVEPSIAATAWPINTNLPVTFQEQEGKWPGYFLCEPGLNIGVNF